MKIANKQRFTMSYRQADVLDIYDTVRDCNRRKIDVDGGRVDRTLNFESSLVTDLYTSS